MTNMENQTQNSLLSFKDELHARPYIKLSNNLRGIPFCISYKRKR